jgi:hypothetical protein
VVAQDSFSRSVTDGWGSADNGGAWTSSGPASWFSVGNSVGTIAMNSGVSSAQYLNSVAQTNLNVVVNIMVDKLAPAPYSQTAVHLRRTGNSGYSVNVDLLPTGGLQIGISKTVNNTETRLKTVSVPAVTYAPGSWLTLRAAVSGTTSTTITGTVWTRGTSEPAAQITAADTTAPLTTPGAIGLEAYQSSEQPGTNTLHLDNLTVTTP